MVALFLFVSSVERDRVLTSSTYGSGESVYRSNKNRFEQIYFIRKIFPPYSP
jgi:hypothetical protein